MAFLMMAKGSLDWDEATTGDVVNRFKKAKTQKPSDRPFFIFIDVNAPLTPDLPANEKPWVKNLERVVDADRKITEVDPASWNAVCFTNYSNHYQETDAALPTESVVMMPMPGHVKFPVPTELLNEIQRAVYGYGFVPNLEPEE